LLVVLGADLMLGRSGAICRIWLFVRWTNKGVLDILYSREGYLQGVCIAASLLASLATRQSQIVILLAANLVNKHTQNTYSIYTVYTGINGGYQDMLDVGFLGYHATTYLTTGSSASIT